MTRSSVASPAPIRSPTSSRSSIRRRRTRSTSGSSIDLALQRRAVQALGQDRGAVVMIVPSTGEVVVLASSPDVDASSIGDPKTAVDAFAALREGEGDPLLPRATQGRYVPGSTFKIVTAIAGLYRARFAGPTFDQAARGGEGRTGRRGLPDPQASARACRRTSFRMTEATEWSSNIWYALAGLRTGGEQLATAAGRLGFGAPIPFDLPTAVSQVTNGAAGPGRLPGRRRAGIGLVRTGRASRRRSRWRSWHRPSRTTGCS